MTVTQIQRFSLHDGPGIRTTVFLKGCNLRCRWCHNPETLTPEPDMQFFADRCIGCGACVAACARYAQSVTADGRRFDRALCVACGSCAEVCYPRAMVAAGQEMSAEAIVQEIVADRDFYQRSGGGVTLSGGDPLFQIDLAGEILTACRGQGVHTVVQTNLAWSWSRVAAVLPLTDLFMVDIKLIDPEAHKRWTGVSNEQVLANLQKLATQGVSMIVRTPVVQGVNATADEIGRIADIVASLDTVLYYELVPYHPLGTSKYASLGMDYPVEAFARPSPAALGELAATARSRGIDVRCVNVEAGGGSTA